MSRQKIKILVVEGDEEFLSFIEAVLSKDHYIVTAAKTGSIALKKIFQDTPDLILLDMDASRIGGHEIRQRLKRDVLYRHLPILYMSSSRRVFASRVGSAGIGKEEILFKPFESDELLGRVQEVLEHCAKDLDVNPITRLPGHASFLREVDSYIHYKRPFVCLRADISHFTATNERYGWKQGDEILAALARLILEVVRVQGNTEDFVGHLGADDFVVITTPEKAETLASQLITKFDESRGWFYEEQDRRNGWTLVRDRRGREQRVPLVSLVVVGVNSAVRPLSHAGELAKVTGELLHYAKTSGKSLYVLDRRTALEPVAR